MNGNIMYNEPFNHVPIELGDFVVNRNLAPGNYPVSGGFAWSRDDIAQVTSLEFVIDNDDRGEWWARIQYPIKFPHYVNPQSRTFPTPLTNLILMRKRV